MIFFKLYTQKCIAPPNQPRALKGLTSFPSNVLILPMSFFYVHQMDFGITYMTLLASYTLHLLKTCN